MAYERVTKAKYVKLKPNTVRMYKNVPPEEKDAVWREFAKYVKIATQRDAGSERPEYPKFENEASSDAYDALIEDADEGLGAYWGICERNLLNAQGHKKKNTSESQPEVDEWSTDGEPVDGEILTSGEPVDDNQSLIESNREKSDNNLSNQTGGSSISDDPQHFYKQIRGSLMDSVYSGCLSLLSNAGFEVNNAISEEIAKQIFFGKLDLEKLRKYAEQAQIRSKTNPTGYLMRLIQKGE